MRLRQRLGQAGLGEDGFTLAEILMACFLTVVGLVAVASGFGMGLQGVETGRQQTTAVFLAEQRVDDAKALAAAAPNLALVTAANLPNEAYGSIPSAGGYRRAVIITPFIGPAGGLPVGTQGSRVDVQVFYRPVTGWGVLSAERQVQVSVFLARR